MDALNLSLGQGFVLESDDLGTQYNRETLWTNSITFVIHKVRWEVRYPILPNSSYVLVSTELSSFSTLTSVALHSGCIHLCNAWGLFLPRPVENIFTPFQLGCFIIIVCYLTKIRSNIKLKLNRFVISYILIFKHKRYMFILMFL